MKDTTLRILLALLCLVDVWLLFTICGREL